MPAAEADSGAFKILPLERIPVQMNRDALWIPAWRMSFSENRVPLFRDMRLSEQRNARESRGMKESDLRGVRHWIVARAVAGAGGWGVFRGW
jgi:hypothetical protein